MQWTSIKRIQKLKCFKMSRLIFLIYLVTVTVKKEKVLQWLTIYRDHSKQLVSSSEYFSAWILSSNCHYDGFRADAQRQLCTQAHPIKVTNILRILWPYECTCPYNQSLLIYLAHIIATSEHVPDFHVSMFNL